MRQREPQRLHRYYSATFLGLLVILVSIGSIKQYQRILSTLSPPSNTTFGNSAIRNVTATNLVVSTTPSSPSSKDVCERAREINPDAILANATIDLKDIDPNNSKLNDESIEFSILVFSERVDKYISKKILNGKVHEKDLSNFIAKALPPTHVDSTTNEEEESNDSSDISSSNNNENDVIWAVDIGANVGYHSLHMAKRGAHVIAFEPAPDTRALLECSAAMLMTSIHHHESSNSKTHGGRGSIQIIPAGASNEPSEGFMARHPESPGMTTFHTNLDNSFPFEKVNFSNIEKNAKQNDDESYNNHTNTSLLSSVSDHNMTNQQDKSNGSIQLVRVQDILEAKGVPEGRSSQLRLLKLDAEGFELKALQGLNLTRFPFQYFTFEFFPSMLREKNGGDDSTTGPLELLWMVREAGYTCNKDGDIGSTKEEMQAWIDGIAESQHVNMFCQLES